MAGKALPLLVLAGALALVAAACGGGGSDSASSEGQAYADAVASNFTEPRGGEESPISDDEANCAGTRIVEALGVERLSDAGATPESIRESDSVDDVVPDLTSEEADEIATAIYDCVDVSALFVQGFAASAAEDGVTISDDKLECLANNFESSEQLRDAFTQSIITGEDPDFQTDTGLLLEILGDCFTLEELVEIGQQTADE